MQLLKAEFIHLGGGDEGWSVKRTKYLKGINTETVHINIQTSNKTKDVSVIQRFAQQGEVW